MNLINKLGDTRAEHAVLTTYVFDPYFFSQEAIDSLHDAGVSSPVVIMDSDKYQSLIQDGITDRSMGNEYYLEPIQVNDVFHPKVGFFSGEEECGFLVSSANVTLSEYTTAAQLAIQGTVQKEGSSRNDIVKIAQDVRQFIQSLNSEYVTGGDSSTKIEKAVSNSKWLEEKETSPSDSEEFIRFLHNLKSPVLDQAMELIQEVAGGYVEISKATMLAPFFGSESRLTEMDDKISADEYEVLISEGDTYIEVEGTLDALENVSFRSLAYDSNRWIHAKALLLEGSWGSAILSGSPNMTGSALLSTASNGNLESAVLTISTSNSDSRLSSSLWSQEAFDVDVGECIDPSEVETESYSLSEMGSETRVTDYEVKLEDAQAKVRSDEEAEITFSATGVEVDEEVRVAASSGNSEFFSWRPNEQGGDTGDAVSVTVGLPKTFVHQPVRLEVNGKKSNYRQITTEPVEYAREQSDILRSGGKKGVRPLIDQALFENYSVASSAISRSVKKLEGMEQTQEEEKKEKEELTEGGESDEDNGRSWGGDIDKVSETSRDVHLELKDGMEFSLNEVRRLLEEGVKPDNVEDLLAHLNNFYYLIHRSLVRTYIESQIPEREEVRTELNTSRLHDISVSMLEEAHDNMTNLPAEVQQQLNEVVDYHPDLEVDRETHFKCFFVYPAAILNLMEWHDEFFIDRFRFTQDIYRTYCEAHPYFAEKLLDGHLAESMSDELHEEVDEGISRFNEVLGLDSKVSIPDDHGRGTRILMYAIWYRELDESGSVDTYYTPDEKGRYLLVSNPKTSEYRFEKVDRAEGEYAKRESEVSMSEKVKMSKYSTESIERMAELALDGQEVVRTDGEYEDLTSSGALDSTLSLLKKTNPDDIIRGLAEAGDDTAF